MFSISCPDRKCKSQRHSLTQHHKSAETMAPFYIYKTASNNVIMLAKPLFQVDHFRPFPHVLFAEGYNQETFVNNLLCLLERKQTFETILLSVLPLDLFFPDWFSLFLPACCFAFEISHQYFLSVFLDRGREGWANDLKKFFWQGLFVLDCQTERFVNKLRD